MKNTEFMDELEFLVMYAFEECDRLMEKFFPSLDWWSFDEFYMSKSLCRIQLSLLEGGSITQVIKTSEYIDWVEKSLEEAEISDYSDYHIYGGK